MSEKIECWRCGEEYDENDFCPECDADIEPNEPKDCKSTASKYKKPEYETAYILKYQGKETNPPLYIKCVGMLSGADFASVRIKHKATGRVYKVGERKLFYESKGEKLPPLIEHTRFYEIKYTEAWFYSKEIKTAGRHLTETKAFDSGQVKIAYTKTYTEERSGKPIIFVHGNGESGRIFVDIAERLSAEYMVYCPDTRGHGKSGKVKRLSYLDIANDIVNLIEHENMESPIFFGFSDGGIVGLLLAMKHPDLLEKLIVAGVNLTPNGIKSKWRRIMKLGFFFSRSDKLRLMLTQPNVTANDLKGIKTPTTVFYAEDDVVEIADSQAVVDNVESCKLIIVNGENHGSYILDNNKLYKHLKEHT